MMTGIEAVRPGATLGDIGAVIQRYAESQGFSVVQDFCGHGLGTVFHDAPSVLHYGVPGTGLVLQEGMFFTIEPMINAGGPATKILQDGLDRRYPRPETLGPVRTFHGRHGGRLRNLHRLAARLAEAALRNRRAGSLAAARRGTDRHTAPYRRSRCQEML